MRYNIEVTGINELKKFLVNLPKRMNEEVKDKALLNIAYNLRDRMRRRAPVSTGALRDSIVVIKGPEGPYVEVGMYYGVAQELGYISHWIPMAYMIQHKTQPQMPGQPNPKSYPYGEPGFKRFKYVTKHTPFVRPAIESAKEDIYNIIQNAVKNAIEKSRK